MTKLCTILFAENVKVNSNSHHKTWRLARHNALWLRSVILFVFYFSQAFFVKDYIMNHPEDGDKIGRLRELMFEQVCLKKPDLIFTRLYIHLCFALIIHVCLRWGFSRYDLHQLDFCWSHFFPSCPCCLVTRNSPEPST